jgi:hypothetical protein
VLPATGNVQPFRYSARYSYRTCSGRTFHSNPGSAKSHYIAFYFLSRNEGTSDIDYGSFVYPQFHEPLWGELCEISYSFDVTLFEPGSDVPLFEYFGAATMISWVPMSPAPIGPIGPVLGPPTAPLLNGIDAFQAQSGVGEQPVISWSLPALGSLPLIR